MWLYLTLMHYVDVGDLEHSGFGEPLYDSMIALKIHLA
jgi:hypothetical protein